MEFFLEEYLIRLFTVKTASYFRESFSLIFINFGFKLHNTAQVNFMSSTCCIIATGMVPLKYSQNLFDLFLFQYELANLLKLRLSHLAFHSCTSGTTNLQRVGETLNLSAKSFQTFSNPSLKRISVSKTSSC